MVVATVCICPVEGCGRERRQHDLMCAPCWKQVPPALQKAVWNYYGGGQREALLSTEYQRASQSAIEFVSSLKNRSTKLVTTKRLYALSGTQPWFHFILHNGKDIENREWPTERRGTIALHAAKKMTKAGYEEAISFALERLGSKMKLPFIPYEALERGAIVGLVDIIGCVKQHSSPWFQGQFGFVLANPRPLRDPIPCKGMLGFWELSVEIAKQIDEQLGEQ